LTYAGNDALVPFAYQRTEAPVVTPAHGELAGDDANIVKMVAALAAVHVTDRAMHARTPAKVCSFAAAPVPT